MSGFQSTRPVRGATVWNLTRVDYMPFQSTRPVRGATSALPPRSSRTHVSIHAPRAGRDYESEMEAR
ncbi:hypothetical protein HMPREF9081_1893 [Centipeda periodontii DSM 2778]|uniref:Uncharacterized protein n=1 Tax=Centipeda periodontii DSM 2778 TaxID=888060 RepID=F5RNS2_9FIRM|nr:hypothetical protein HMPREF9081_1893 [Centipeda periodontii DSM 2778]